jgi:anaerobic ribonucleoside-triphosphate reductase activating protein
MRINKIIKKTYAEGPGCRFCVWVQGCSHHCLGCFATDLWNYDGGYEISVSQILNQFESVKDDVCGLTFLGGEPFDKAEELSLVAECVKALGKNIITFTGYTYDYLAKSNNNYWHKLINYTDLLIDGKFEKSLLDYSRPLVGSSNQRFIFLTDKISKQEIDNYNNRFEIRSDINGNLTFNGMGNIEKLQKYINNL